MPDRFLRADKHRSVLRTLECEDFVLAGLVGLAVQQHGFTHCYQAFNVPSLILGEREVADLPQFLQTLDHLLN